MTTNIVSATNASSQTDDRVEFMYHPTFWTSDRDAMAQWIKRVFGRSGVFQGDWMKTQNFSSDYPSDYSHYTWISDIWFDVIQPDLYRLPGAPASFSPPLDRLSELGWHSTNPEAVYQAARKNGVRVIDQRGQQVETEQLPTGTSLVSDDVVLVWLDARDVGLSVEIASIPEAFRQHGLDLFPRYSPDWTQPSVSKTDPLSIIRGSHHTVLTTNLKRALRGSVDVLGGRIIHSEENPLLGTRSTYVYLADSVIEYAEPLEPNGPLHQEWDPAPMSILSQRQEDIYHSITFLVEDLEKAVAHLKSQGIKFEHQSDTMVLTDPKDCLGMRWGFTSALVSKDPRKDASL